MTKNHKKNKKKIFRVSISEEAYSNLQELAALEHRPIKYELEGLIGAKLNFIKRQILAENREEMTPYNFKDVN